VARVVRYAEGAIGVLRGDTVHDISGLVDERWRGTPYAMTELIRNWNRVADRANEIAGGDGGVGAARAGLLAPLPSPPHIFAAPLNYRDHVDEMVGSRHAPTALKAGQSPAELGFFLKAPGSICGPGDAIELPPLPGRAFHHEIELGAVIGKPAQGVAAQDALGHVFGYLCVLDITMRTDGGYQEERVLRKSFQTFTPLGACIVTADEIDDVASLGLRLWVGDELRQNANTRDLIVGVDRLISDASNVLTLSPGDLYMTGTPDGVGPIVAGDRIRAEIDQVGSMELDVVQRTW
jgi:2-keto-4-pentenoate hydratase/2-oxohepta-3-ene-1,7-dioic acid hydratase in catechol pathway